LQEIQEIANLPAPGRRQFGQLQQALPLAAGEHDAPAAFRSSSQQSRGLQRAGRGDSSTSTVGRGEFPIVRRKHIGYPSFQYFKDY
jgi:hypothetical protein